LKIKVKEIIKEFYKILKKFPLKVNMEVVKIFKIQKAVIKILRLNIRLVKIFNCVKIKNLFRILKKANKMNRRILRNKYNSKIIIQKEKENLYFKVICQLKKKLVD
jgi:hypothetical protein